MILLSVAPKGEGAPKCPTPHLLRREDAEMMKIACCAVALVALLLVAGCGGGGMDMPAAPDAPAPFIPTTHSGYAVYLLGGMYDTSYIAQDASDAFTVQPGAYRPVCLRADEVGIAQVNTCGGIDWQASIVDANGNLVSPTPEGWVLGPGSYTGTVPNPGGGEISFTITVVPGDLGDLRVRMIPVDLAGNRFTRDAEGHYQVPIYTTFEWAQEWTNGNRVVSQERYSAYASTISGSNSLTWDNGGYYSSVVTVCTFAVQVYDMTHDQMGGSDPVTVDTVTIDFYYQQ